MAAFGLIYVVLFFFSLILYQNAACHVRRKAGAIKLFSVQSFTAQKVKRTSFGKNTLSIMNQMKYLNLKNFLLIHSKKGEKNDSHAELIS